MSNSNTLEHKIDELLRSLGGLERLRDLARLSSLDHLVNLHLLSHLTKLDKIEGLDRLNQLDRLTELSKLDSLQVIQQLTKLEKLEQLDELKHLEKLDNLTELKVLEGLEKLKELEKLGELSKLNDLHRLDALASLRDLGGLERLDHLKYLENLDRLNELTALTQLESLKGLKELLDVNAEKLSQLRHLEALDNLPLLDKLSQLDKLEKLDELKALDKLSELSQLDRLTALTDAPPIVPEVAPPVQQVVVEKAMSHGWQMYVINFALSIVSAVVVAGVLVLLLLVPQGRGVANNALAFLGFGQGAQVSWALETLSQSTPQEFPRYWEAFEARLSQEIDLVFSMKAPWTLDYRFQTLQGVWSYDYQYQGVSLHTRVQQTLRETLDKFETKYMDRLNIEIGQVMLRQNDNQKLTQWNQVKDLLLASKWDDVLKLARQSDDRFLQEAAVISMVHLQLTDSAKLVEIMEI